MKEVKINNEIEQDSLNYYLEEYKNVFVLPPEIPERDFIDYLFAKPHYEFQYNYIHKYLGEVEGKKFLDVGNGLGVLVTYLRKDGCESYGYEVDERLFKISEKVRELNQLPECFYYVPEGKLPFPDEFFDTAYAYFVVEHVKDLDTFFHEIIRVIKPGGKFLFITCNYNLPFDSHYSMFLPVYSKNLTKVVLRLAGKNVEFFEGINFVTPKSIEKSLSKLSAEDNKILYTNLGKQDFMENLDDTELHSPMFIKITKILRKIGAINLLIKANLYNPLIYLVEKK